MTEATSTLSVQTEDKFLEHSDGSRVAYRFLSGGQPGVIFCGGFNSDMQGCKAQALEKACAKAGRQFTRFDYRGHGTSSGKLEDHVVSDWLADAELILEQVARGPLVIVGSSMGMWITCLLLKKHPQRFVGCIGIASAPDFTRDIMWPRLSKTQHQQLAAGETVRAGSEYDPEGYPVRQALFDDGEENLVLDNRIPVCFPVCLFHGTSDESVPWQHSIKLMNSLQGDNIQLRLIKGGDHRLSEPAQLEEIIAWALSC